MAPSPKMAYTSRAPPNPVLQPYFDRLYKPKAAQLPSAVIDQTRGKCSGGADECYFGFA